MKAVEAYRLLVLPDMHVPLHDRKALDGILKFAAEESWDEIIQLGDFLDMESVSSHAKGKPRQIEGQRISEDYAFGRKVLAMMTDGATAKNSKCKKILLEGNHEFRIEKFLDEHPYMEGMVEVAKGLELAESGWQWVRAHRDGQLHRVGQSYYCHGLYTNQHHAKKHAEAFGVPWLFYGHTHCLQTFSTKRFGAENAIRATSCGKLCDNNPKYMHGRPHNWTTSFTVNLVDTQGRVTSTQVEIADGRFVAPNGKVYGGASTHGPM